MKKKNPLKRIVNKKPLNKKKVRSKKTPVNKRALNKKKGEGELKEVRHRLRKKIGKPVSRLDPKKSMISSLENERLRLYSYRYRLKTMLGEYKTKGAKRIIRNELIKTTRFIVGVSRRKGTYKKRVGFNKSFIDMTKVYKRPVIVQNIYKWDASKFVDNLIDRKGFKKFIVDGSVFSVKDSIGILGAVDELETFADMTDIYFFRIMLDIEMKTVTVSILN